MSASTKLCFSSLKEVKERKSRDKKALPSPPAGPFSDSHWREKQHLLGCRHFPGWLKILKKQTKKKNRFLETTSHQVQNRSVSDKLNLMNSKDQGLSLSSCWKPSSFSFRRASRMPPPKKVLVLHPELLDFSTFLSEETILKIFFKRENFNTVDLWTTEFELGWSTYMWNFFNKYTYVL